MQASQIPAKFVEPFAVNAGAAYIRTIPTTTSTPGAASLDQGFPPLTAVAVGSGGTPPDIKDFNGILNAITQWVWWKGAGGTVGFDATLSTAIGGYPAGALLLAATGDAFWLCTQDNNTNNPDTGGAGWMAIVVKPSASMPLISGAGSIGTSSQYARADHAHPNEWCGSASGTGNAQVITPPPTLTGLSDGTILAYLATATNTGATTIQAGSIGTMSVRKDSLSGPVALTGGEIVAGNTIHVRSAGGYLHLISGARGTASQQNASSGTGTVSAVSGPIVAGNLAQFSDTSGTVVDSGSSVGSLSSSAEGLRYQLGLSY